MTTHNTYRARVVIRGIAPRQRKVKFHSVALGTYDVPHVETLLRQADDIVAGFREVESATLKIEHVEQQMFDGAVVIETWSPFDQRNKTFMVA